MEKKRYIVTHRLLRKNGRRKILYKFRAVDVESAIDIFRHEVRPDDIHEFELLTGDWQHICFLEEW